MNSRAKLVKGVPSSSSEAGQGGSFQFQTQPFLPTVPEGPARRAQKKRRNVACWLIVVSGIRFWNQIVFWVSRACVQNFMRDSCNCFGVYGGVIHISHPPRSVNMPWRPRRSYVSLCFRSTEAADCRIERTRVLNWQLSIPVSIPWPATSCGAVISEFHLWQASITLHLGVARAPQCREDDYLADSVCWYQSIHDCKKKSENTELINSKVD